MILLKLAATLFLAGLPLCAVGRLWGDPHPRIMNGADYVGITGMFMWVGAALLAIVGGLAWVWG